MRLTQILIGTLWLCGMLDVAASSTYDKFEPTMWGDWQTWGQQTDSTYLNPVIPADFSDIDCIEHDGWYYTISSTFQFEPGMVILRSTDMVNWEIASHAVSDVTEISEELDWTRMNRYARGIWAGAIRHHDGLFYVYFGCPDEGMFMTTAKDIEGPWAPLTKMNIGKGWDDCCPLFDDDGKNYFVATHFADGYKTYVFPLSADGKSVDWDKKALINEGAGREASKLYKWNGRYYHMYSEHVDGGRYLMMQRADHPMGPYEEKHRLSHTQSEWNEPNQGGYLQDKEGKWHFLTHHGKGDWGGRQVSLLPVFWTSDGWPVIGIPDDQGIGTFSLTNSMPVGLRGEERDSAVGHDHIIKGFGAPDWEWNYHPREDFYIRTDSTLILKAFRPLTENNLLKAGNTLTLRSCQVPLNEVVVAIDLSGMAEGQRSGICHFSKPWSEFGVMMEDGSRILYHKTDTDVRNILLEDVPENVLLRSHWGLDGLCCYSYSTDGKEWKEYGPLYHMRWGNYRGDRLGIFTYNNDRDQGQAVFSRFSYRWSDKSEPYNPFGNSLVPDMIADASIQLIGDTFYCHATTDGYGRHLETAGPPTVWKSKDFVHWSFDETCFPDCEYEKYWAPSRAINVGEKWYIYPTVNGYMYPCVSESPDGPFRIAKGNTFTLPNRLWVKDKVHAIDAEIFIEDDGTPYAFWGRRKLARLKSDMVTIDTIFPDIVTRRKEYTEGPVFFKRGDIYYYLYTIGGDERYEYYYQISRHSPLGPWETPEQDLICTTDIQSGVFGPGHGCVFNDGDNFYLAYLEFGRRSTNRMTYVSPLEFNDDGTIRQVSVRLDGVGYLRPSDHNAEIPVMDVSASSEASPHIIRHNQDPRCERTEMFAPSFAVDGQNGSRWMAADDDTRPVITLDLGSPKKIGSSELAFVKPTAGHAYELEGSLDGIKWEKIARHPDMRKCSPHVDKVGKRFRYLRSTILNGVKGIYEWKIYE